MNPAHSGAAVFIPFSHLNPSALLSGLAVREETHPNDKFLGEWQSSTARRTFLGEE